MARTAAVISRRAKFDNFLSPLTANVSAAGPISAKTLSTLTTFGDTLTADKPSFTTAWSCAFRVTRRLRNGI